MINVLYLQSSEEKENEFGICDSRDNYQKFYVQRLIWIPIEQKYERDELNEQIRVQVASKTHEKMKIF